VLLFCADTCWRKETNNEWDEEPPTAKEQPTDTQPKGPGSVKDGGHQFQMKMAALIGLRGLQRGDDFELFSNRDDAGNFDDLVYTAGGRRYFLQLKHDDNPDKKKLTKGDLVTLLQSCFKSYCAIKNGDTFKDIPIDNSKFIVYTNKELNPTLLKHKRSHR
jgi:U3 small nucleolar RNA-associated protein 14